MDVWFCVIRRNHAERLNREAMNGSRKNQALSRAQ
jgi:hypothetical protein